MFIDLDDFKTVNDSLGHAAGDTVLQEVAQRLQAGVRPSDTVARFGGDEFAVLLDEIERLGGGRRRRRARSSGRSSSSSTSTASRSTRGRASASASRGHELGSSDAEELLRNADVAMYMAKRDSKGSYRVFEPAMHERVVERLELQSGARSARSSWISSRSTTSPSFASIERADHGVEALLRWMHPTRGTIPPAHFIPLAEETGSDHPDRSLGAAGGVPPRRPPRTSASRGRRR